MRARHLAPFTPVLLALACGGSDADNLFSGTSAGGGGGAAGASAGTGGSQTAGNGTAGSGTAGSGTAGSGTAGSNTAGTGTAGKGTAGSNTAGTGTAGKAAGGSGTAGKGTAGTGTAGKGTAGSNTAGSGTAGTGTAGSNTAGSNTAGTNTAGSNTAGTGTAGSSTQATGDDCSDPFAIDVGDAPVKVSGTTANATNDYNSGGNQCGGSNSKDVVYAVTAKASGNLRVDLATNGYSGSVYVESACGDSGSAFACNANPTGAESTTFPVTAGSTYYVVFDGYGSGDESGAYTATFTLTICGDGVIGQGEECDDKNATPGDGCDAACKFEQNGPCNFQNQENNGSMSPQKVPSTCLTAVANTGSIGSNGDEDWFCQELVAGEHWQVGTFVTPDLSCQVPGGHDTIVEVFASPPPPGLTNFACNETKALLCDDDTGSDTCSALDFLVPADGTYCARVVGKNKSQAQFINVYFSRR